MSVTDTWLEQYYTTGKTSVRVYARAWREADEPMYEGLWRACIQEMSRGIVLAERVQEYTWISKEDFQEWGRDHVSHAYKACDRKETLAQRKPVFSRSIATAPHLNYSW